MIEEGAVGDPVLAGGADKLQLSSSMQIEQKSAEAVTIYLPSSGTRIRIPDKLYQVLLQFETPRNLLEVVGDDARLIAAIAKLRRSGFILGEHGDDEPPPRRLVTDAPVRLFDCPSQKLRASDTDVVVLGVPYDSGDGAAAGARHGPAALRETSLQTLYGIDRRTGRPLGWFDADRGLPILRGVTIGDCGDVLVEHGERQARLFGRITDALGAVTDGDNLPVLLGGDATISLPVIELLQARRPLTVVRIGSAVHAGAPEEASFVSRQTLPLKALRLPGVNRYVQIGPSPTDLGGPSETRPISVAAFRRDGTIALDHHLGTRPTIHLGVDMDALAAPGEEAAGEPPYSRFSYPELHSLIVGIGERCVIASIDIAGLNPLRPGWRVMATACLHLLLIALSAAKDPASKDRPS